MFVDASALAAILLSEPDAIELEQRLFGWEGGLITSPIAIFETVLAVAPKLRLSVAAAEREVMDYVEPEISVIDITAEIGRLAIEARARYGKGTGHPAQLNMGDCFAYGCAKAHGVPLLYKGGDFVHTDLA
ncbi:MAG: type II toxin-antitoxin system VapC family toxin [Hansschlegelia sp.]